MKKSILSIFIFILSLNIAISQPVSDMGVIPIGVTLNSIIRLNIVKGGNIEFVVNTFSQFDLGVAPNAGYETDFTVASSVNFDVELQAENDFLIGQLDVLNKMSIKNLGYIITHTGSLGSPDPANTIPPAAGFNWSLPTVIQILKTTVTTIVEGSELIATPSAGDVAQNAFKIAWQLSTSTVLGDAAGFGDATTKLLAQNLKSDRYVVNVFLHVARK